MTDLCSKPGQFPKERVHLVLKKKKKMKSQEKFLQKKCAVGVKKRGGAGMEIFDLIDSNIKHLIQPLLGSTKYKTQRTLLRKSRAFKISFCPST